MLYKVQNSHITKDNNSVYVCDEKKETNDDKSGKMIHRLTDIKTNKQKPVKENKKIDKDKKVIRLHYSFPFGCRLSLFEADDIIFPLVSCLHFRSYDATTSGQEHQNAFGLQNL